MEGVKRADEAIAGCVKEEREEDEGVRCSLQLKRAQLLKVVVSHTHTHTVMH